MGWFETAKKGYDDMVVYARDAKGKKSEAYGMGMRLNKSELVKTIKAESDKWKKAGYMEAFRDKYGE